MSTSPSTQDLQDELRKIAEQAKTTQSSLQHLRSAKKEADITKRRHEVVTSMKTMQDAIIQLQEQLNDVQTQLEKCNEEKTDESEQDETQEEKKEKPKMCGIVKTRNLNPEQQEALYVLKASRMGAMMSQNQAMKKELLLNKRKKQLLEARYAKSQSYSGSETLRAAHALEAKVRGATLKIQALEDELRKSQQMALRYRELYEDSQRETELHKALDDQNEQRSKSAPRMKPAPLKEQSFIGPNTNVNDVVRKNECLLEENDVQRREIQRLKRDNAELILIAKTAAADRDTVFARLGTSEAARQDLQKRFHKLKNANSQLSRSFTRQAANWIDMKKQVQLVDTQGRWGEIFPVAPHGSKDRFNEHCQKENTSMPRQMYPVECYGGTSTA